MRSLADALEKAQAKSGPITFPSGTPQNTQKKPAIKNKPTILPNEARVGDLYSFDMLYDGQRGPKPCILWGIYRDTRRNIQAVDLLGIDQFRPHKRSYSVDLKISSYYAQTVFGLTGPRIIDCGQIFTVPNADTKNGGHLFPDSSKKASVQPLGFPDIILRRGISMAVGGRFWIKKVDIDPNWEREGILFPTVEYWRLDTHTPEVRGPDGHFVCKISENIPGAYTQSEIDRIVEWTFFQNQDLLPDPAQYPDWIDFDIPQKPGVDNVHSQRRFC